jgi:hypothetical protein
VHPPPQIRTCILERELRLPAQLRIRPCRIGCQIQHVARSPPDDFIWQLPSHSITECFDHLEDSAATPRAEVPGSDAGVDISEVVECSEVPFGEINYVDVIADGGTVAGFVVWRRC